MRKSAIAAAAFALVLTGCASKVRFADQGYFTILTINPNEPNVEIDESWDPPRILVDREPIYPRATGRRTHIKWALPTGSSYTFNDIVIRAVPGGLAPTGLNCTPGTYVVNCVYDTPETLTRYKYDIIVNRPKGSPIRLDPYIVN